MAYDLEQLTTDLTADITDRNQQPAQKWVDKLQLIYHAGMKVGVNDAYSAYLTQTTDIAPADLATKIPDFEQLAQTRTQQIAQTLAEQLTQQSSQDYKIMDDRIANQIGLAQGTTTWNKENLVVPAKLRLADLLYIYFAGYQYGFQISYWQALAENKLQYQDQQISPADAAQLAQETAVSETNDQMQSALDHKEKLAAIYDQLLND
ncbi:hypothetical protein [Loigolactobacillus zhaoyuanensis]|uniref:Uncharacterized protein n=1 Tax=Loigolactobacillus zhaoyuanensis TaxID=2486017 RepID=A0ABW8U876_9LACO|nr:hypothetical protein [Loigolactobacillus zhaoyuanensis]